MVDGDDDPRDRFDRGKFLKLTAGAAVAPTVFGVGAEEAAAGPLELIPGRTARLLRRKDVAVYRSIRGREYVYRRNELLVVASDAKRALAFANKIPNVRATELKPVAGLPDDRIVNYLPRFGVTRIRVTTTLRGTAAKDLIPRLAIAMRRQKRTIQASPHYIFGGVPGYLGEPAGPAAPGPPVNIPGEGAGSGIRVAVLDTGYFPGVHREIDRRIAELHLPNVLGTSPAVLGNIDTLDGFPADGHLDDESGHGEFIAGVVLQHAPSATLLVAKVLDSFGAGAEADIANGIGAAVAAGAHVINLSLCACIDDEAPPVALEPALAYAVMNGVAVVAAAGNDNISRPVQPAASKHVTSVAATDNARVRASWSNHGQWVDCCTPAVGVNGAFGVWPPAPAAPVFDGWAIWQGTSFAAPKIAGRIAAMISPAMTAQQAAAALVNDPTQPIIGDIGRFHDL